MSMQGIYLADCGAFIYALVFSSEIYFYSSCLSILIEVYPLDDSGGKCKLEIVFDI